MDLKKQGRKKRFSFSAAHDIQKGCWFYLFPLIKIFFGLNLQNDKAVGRYFVG
jgi:hypothetical protein